MKGIKNIFKNLANKPIYFYSYKLSPDKNYVTPVETAEVIAYSISLLFTSTMLFKVYSYYKKKETNTLSSDKTEMSTVRDIP